MKRKFFIIYLVVISICLSGCNLSRKKKTDTKKSTNEVDYVESMDDLEDGGYYIYHDDKYYLPYIGSATFNTSSDRSDYSNSGRVAWFMDDFNKIPTLYEGDYLVYYTNNKLNEKFNIERFEYFGYTVGISGLYQKSSGRYAFDATKSNSGTSHINNKSDAGRLLELSSSEVIIDNIGGSKLRSGNITRAGTIYGLEQDKLYAADLYVGTNLNTYVLKADTIALVSMEHTSTNDYTLLRSKILRINLPKNLNDGYYAVNGSGIFRYVNGKSYTENTDFNVPNEKETAKNSEDDSEQRLEDDNDVIKENFTVNRSGKITVEVTYGENMKADYAISDPVAKLIGDSSVYTLTHVDEGKMSVTVKVDAGEYTLELTGLYGRNYKYAVYQEKTDE